MSNGYIGIIFPYALLRTITYIWVILILKPPRKSVRRVQKNSHPHPTATQRLYQLPETASHEVWGYIEMMEKKMETTIGCWGYRLWASLHSGVLPIKAVFTFLRIAESTKACAKQSCQALLCAKREGLGGPMGFGC